MVCQLCVDGETCPECEKYPHDIHATPPNDYLYTTVWHNTMDLRTPEMRIAQLERDVRELRSMINGIAEKFKRWGYDHQ